MSLSIFEAKQSAVERALMSAFGTTELDAIAPVAGGMSDARIFRIRVGGIAYLLRLEGTRDAFRDPHRWYGCMSIAAQALLAPRLRYADPDDGVIIMDFIAERSLFTDHPGPRTALVTDMAQAVRALHQTSPFPPLADYMDAMQSVIGQFRGAGIVALDATAALFARYATLAAVYRTDPADLVSSHNDLNPRNVLYDGARVWFVDWETSFLTDRYVDLATIANFMRFSDAEQDLMLRVYFGQPPSAIQKARLYLMRQINHVFYGMIFLIGAAAERPGAAAPGEIDEAAELAALHDGLGSGAFSLDVWNGRVAYGMSRLKAAMAGMAGPAFDEAAALLR